MESVGEHHVRYRGPNRPGQIGAGFHHDGNIGGCAVGDGESKAIALHTNAYAIRNDQRIPWHCRKTSTGREGTPSCRARQIAD